MSYSREKLLEIPIFRHFNDICQVPRPSKNEGQFSDFLLNWALRNGLEASQDAVKNVFIRKPAAVGYEAAPTVMLQAHMDMVCEKTPDAEHDFDTDPINWQIDGDIVSTGGKTTLGADNGIGMAYAMAVLLEKNLKHPALEVLFTVAEEEDFTGAIEFDATKSNASRLINLDHANDREVLCGSCGGMAVDVHIPLKSQPIPDGWVAYELVVSGLKGGHSGEDIARGHGNANSFLARVLSEFESRVSFLIGTIKGGSLRLAIPRDARGAVFFPKNNISAMKEIVNRMEKTFKGELSQTGKQLELSFTATDHDGWCVDATPVISALLLSPDGIYQMNETLPGIVDASDNMGEVYLSQDDLHIVFEVRSSVSSVGEYLEHRIGRMARICGGTHVSSKKYPSWDFEPQSALRDIAGHVYEEKFGCKPDYLSVHAGLEVGVLSEKKPRIDAIAIGPNCFNFHSPSENFSISSAEKSYEFLRSILENLRR